MADEKKQADKEALKAQKQAEKEALKAKKERIKQSKPKKEGNVFTRIFNAIKKFFKDFKGTCKKVIWPDKKTVLRNTLIVFITVVVVGAGIWIFDYVCSVGIREIQGAISDSVAEEESGDAETTTNSLLSELTSSLSGSASAENVTE